MVISEEKELDGCRQLMHIAQGEAAKLHGHWPPPIPLSSLQHQWGRRLEGWPNTRPAWLAAGGWPSRVWLCTWWTLTACPDWPHQFFRSGGDLQYYWMDTKHRHELRHARKAWPSTLVDPSLLSVQHIGMYTVQYSVTDYSLLAADYTYMCIFYVWECTA